MENNEIWKDIPGFEGYYQVSNLGRVRSMDRMCLSNKREAQKRRGQIMKNKNSRGYDCVALSKNKKATYYRTHRLVAMMFVPNPQNLPQINHKDCDVHNNRADNLEWCTAKYNCNYADHNKKLSETATKRFQDPEEYRKLVERVRKQSQDPSWKLHQRHAQLNNSNSKKVEMLDLQGNVIQVFPSLAEAHRKTGIFAQNIGQVCLGRKSIAGGYKWRYVNENNG